jgi:HlyD family secretion protein
MIRDTSAQDHVVGAAPSRRPLWLWGGAGLLVLLVAGSALSHFSLGDRSVSAERLRIAEVSQGTLLRDAAVNGRVVAAVSPTLYAPAAGTITLAIAAGDRVDRGQVLATLASPELDNLLEREQATLAELETMVARQRIQASRNRLLAQRNADEAELTRVAAERELERVEQGYQRGAIAEVDYRRAQDTLDGARLRAEHAAADVRLEGEALAFELKTAESQLARQRLAVADLERRVDELNVRAPVDGVVGTLGVVDRAVVPANAPLMTVVDLERLEVEIEVPENYAEDLGLGMLAEVRVGAMHAPGRIVAVSPEVVNRQVLARVRFDGQQPPGLRQNQRITARVVFEERPDVLLLARGPFLEAHNARFAYVVRDGVAERRALRIGATSIAAIEILDGLVPGERVVIAGSDTFEDAERVRIN